MAIDMKDSGTVGCAYYVAIDEALFLQEDISMAGIEFVEMLLLRVEPTTVLISLRSPENLVDFLEAGAQDFDGNREGIQPDPDPGHWHHAHVPVRRVPRRIYTAHVGFLRVQL